VSTTTLWLIAVGAALAALALGLLALLLRRAPARGNDEQHEAAPDLEAQRLRDAAWFASTLELDALSLRIVEAALAACRGDGAAVGVRRPGAGSPIVEALYLSDDELAWLAPGLRADNESAAVMRYPNGEPDSVDERIKTTLIVPLPGRQGDSVGNVAVVWRRDLQGGVDEQLQLLDGIAKAAWSAIDNAFRFEEAQASRPRT
jgi:hypothetical protein